MPTTPKTEYVEHHGSAATADDLIDKRQAGVCLHLTALPGPHGIGEIGRDAHHFIDTIARAGLKVWQFLPTGPTAYGDSPYQPLSTFAGNPMLIELRELTELGLLQKSELTELTTLPSDYVNYGALIPAKTALLRVAAHRFHDEASRNLKDDFEQFVADHDTHWLHDYALFRALKEQHESKPWPLWEKPFRDRDATYLGAFAQDNSDELHYFKFCEFLFHKQWQRVSRYAAASGVALFGDMPIYIALDSADAWANRQLLRLDDSGQPTKVAGVPPDYFSADGQLWGNPVYDWAYHDETGYAWWISRMTHTMSLMDIVRIDHFRGFEAYWSIPADASTARDGIWEPGPNDAVFDAIRAALGDLPVVAEDLGEITPAVDELRIRQRLPGMAVLQFLVDDPAFSPGNISVDSVCYTGTHDNDTTVGWFHGGDQDMRSIEQISHTQHNALRHTGGQSDDIHWAMIKLAFSTQACLAVIPMQDFLGLGSKARTNTPGAAANNWQWRLQDSVFDAELERKIAGLVTAHHR